MQGNTADGASTYRCRHLIMFITPRPNMRKLQIIKVGASTGVILNKEVIAKLRVKKRDSLFLTEVPGGYLLTPNRPEFERQIKLPGEIMHEDRDILRALSKREL